MSDSVIVSRLQRRARDCRTVELRQDLGPFNSSEVATPKTSDALGATSFDSDIAADAVSDAPLPDTTPDDPPNAGAARSIADPRARSGFNDLRWEGEGATTFGVTEHAEGAAAKPDNTVSKSKARARTMSPPRYADTRRRGTSPPRFSKNRSREDERRLFGDPSPRRESSRGYHDRGGWDRRYSPDTRGGRRRSPSPMRRRDEYRGGDRDRGGRDRDRRDFDSGFGEYLDDGDDNDDVIIIDEVSPPSTNRSKAKGVEPRWTCSQCTLLNPESVTQCAACGRWRFGRGAPAASRPTAGGSEGPALPKGAESNHRKGKGKRKRERPARLSADKAAKAAAEVARRAPRDGGQGPALPKGAARRAPRDGGQGPALPKGAESNHRKGKGKRKRERPARLSADKAAKAAAEVARRAPRDGDGSPFFLCDGDIVDAFLGEIDARAGRPNADFLRARLREKSKLTDPLPGDAPLDASRGAIVYMPGEDEFYNYAGASCNSNFHRRGLPVDIFTCCRHVFWLHAAPTHVAGMKRQWDGGYDWCSTFRSMFQTLRMITRQLPEVYRNKPVVMVWLDVFPSTDYRVPVYDVESSIGSVDITDDEEEITDDEEEQWVEVQLEEEEEEEEEEDPWADEPEFDPDDPEYDDEDDDPDWTYGHYPERGQPLGDIEIDDAESVAIAMMETQLVVANEYGFTLNLCSRKMEYFLHRLLEERAEQSGIPTVSLPPAFGEYFPHPSARYHYKAREYAAYVLFGKRNTGE